MIEITCDRYHRSPNGTVPASAGTVKGVVAFKVYLQERRTMSENPKRVYKTKRSIMRGTTLDALRFLYYYGPCYKDDFIKTLGKRGSESFDRLTKKILEERKADGFVFREIEADGKKRQAGQTATMVALSPVSSRWRSLLLLRKAFSGLPPIQSFAKKDRIRCTAF